MPAKRRKAIRESDDLDSKRRVTRSSARATASSEGAAGSMPTKSAPRKDKDSKFSQAKSRARMKKPVEDRQSNNQSVEATNAPTTLIIQHVTLKNPVTCHQYASPFTSDQDPTTLIFTHGAGGTLSAPAVVNFCTGYSTKGDVLAFQGSMNLNARVKGFHACISHLYPGSGKVENLVLSGRSMGARAAVIAATEFLSLKTTLRPTVSLVLVSYPLKGPKDDVRDKILFSLPSNVRVLFVIGDKDSMCPLPLLRATLKKMSAEATLFTVKGADHGMHLKPVALERQLGIEAGSMAASWVQSEIKGGIYIGKEDVER